MDARLREGIRLFNAGEYFASHESLEDFYRAAEEVHRPFIEGLIGLAAALRIFRDLGDGRGVVRMVQQSLIRLEHYQPTYLGVRVGDLIGDMEIWVEKVRTDSARARNEIPAIRLRWFSFLLRS